MMILVLAWIFSQLEGALSAMLALALAIWFSPDLLAESKMDIVELFMPEMHMKSANPPPINFIGPMWTKTDSYPYKKL